MPTCAIKWCGNNTSGSGSTKDGVSFHRFPKIPDIKEKWIEATQRKNWYPQTKSVICSKHFTPDCLDNSKKLRRLFSSAVPTLFLPVLASRNDTSDLKIHKNSEPGCSHQYVLSVNEDEASNHEDPTTSSIIRNAVESHIKDESTDNTTKSDLQLNSAATIAEKALCRRVADLSMKLRQSQLHVKSLQDKNRFLKTKLNTIAGSLEKLKSKGSITQENIDIERLQASNRQLRKKVVLLRRLLSEQKEKNICAKRNVIWCPPAEGMLDESDAKASE